VDLEHVEQLRQAFLAAGVPAASVTGKMSSEERRRVLDEFRAGQHRVLVSCELLTEGFDERSVSCVVLARPTQSLGFYQQSVGRGLRSVPASGKRDCLILDVRDRGVKHRVVTAANLFEAHVQDCEGQDVLEVAIAAQRSYDVKPLVPTP